MNIVDGFRTYAVLRKFSKYAFAYALKSDGTVWAWGQNSNGELGDGTTTARTEPVQVSGLSYIASIHMGNMHGLALTDVGTVYAWGFNQNGQVGDGTNTNRLVPVQVPGLSHMKMNSDGGNGGRSTPGIVAGFSLTPQ